MPTKIIREAGHVDALAAILRGRKLPITVSWAQGAPRTGVQNNLAFRWYADIARQLGDETPGRVRAECKVRFAAPILCEDNETFRASWRKLRNRLTYEEVVEFVEATELPMTSAMTVRQMTEFMDVVQREYSAQGVRLTDPEALKYETEFGPVVTA
jgi:hypothetical protein